MDKFYPRNEQMSTEPLLTKLFLVVPSNNTLTRSSGTVRNIPITQVPVAH